MYLTLALIQGAVNLVLLVLLVRIIYKLLPLVFLKSQTLPFVPVTPKVTKAIVQSCILEGKKHIVDLGCGDGMLLTGLQHAYPNAELFGIEHKRSLVWLAKLRFLFRPWVHISQGDMFAYDISTADAIVGFWIPDVTTQLLQKFEQECSKHVVIISYMFPLPKSKYFTERTLVVTKKDKLFIYEPVS